MPRRKKEATPQQTPLERIRELIDEKVRLRGEARLAEHDLTREIVALAAEARKHEEPMAALAERMQVMDLETRELRPITRQAVDNAIAFHEGRRTPKTTRASRRRREPAGHINAEALR
jgi:hypothetical protein